MSQTIVLQETEQDAIRKYPTNSLPNKARIRKNFIPDILAVSDNGILMLDNILETQDGKIRAARDTRKDRKRMERVLRLFRAYFVNPVTPMRDMWNEIGRGNLDYAELLEDFELIKSSEMLQDLLTHDSIHPRLVGYMKEQLMYPDRLKKVFSKEDRVSPFSVEFHPALGCNSHCLGCSNIDAEGNFIGYDKLGEPLTLEQATMLSDAFLDMGVERATISGGGEPLVSNLTVPLIDHIRRQEGSVNLGLYTNGINLSKLSESELEILVRSLNRVRVSLDAATSEDWGAYKRCDPSIFYVILHSISGLVKLRDRAESKMKIGASCIASLRCQGRKLIDFINLCTENGLDFCDVKVFCEADDTKRDCQCDKASLSDIVDEIITARDEGKFGRTNVFLEEPFVMERYRDRFRVPRQEIKMPSRCWMARAGKKVTIGPYGEIYPCSDAANPGVLRVLHNEPRMAVLNNFANLRSVRNQFLQIWREIGGKRDSFYPGYHPYCVPSNQDYNIAMEKLFVDWDAGIHLDCQPITARPQDYHTFRGIQTPVAAATG